MPSSVRPPGGAAQLVVILGGRAKSGWTQFFSLVRGPLAPQVVIVEDEIPEVHLGQAPAPGSLGEGALILLSSKSFPKFESGTKQKLLHLELKPKKDLGC